MSEQLGKKRFSVDHANTTGIPRITTIGEAVLPRDPYCIRKLNVRFDEMLRLTSGFGVDENAEHYENGPARDCKPREPKRAHRSRPTAVPISQHLN